MDVPWQKGPISLESWLTLIHIFNQVLQQKQSMTHFLALHYDALAVRETSININVMGIYN